MSKKKVLICGASGMAGHMIYFYLSKLEKYTITTTARTTEYISPSHILDIEDSLGLTKLKNIINYDKPDIIINCIGLLVKACEIVPDRATFINSYFPHYLEAITKDTNIKIIHLSTDCVFSGDRLTEGYHENDISDGKDVYAKSKYLGELNNSKDLTIRTSIIGAELRENGTGLFEWFIKQKGGIKGYNKVYWNGITTLELAKQLDNLIDLNVTGIYHLVPDFFITKYQLLRDIQELWLKTDINILLDNTIKCNKVLVNNRKDEYTPKIGCYIAQLIELRYFLNRDNYAIFKRFKSIMDK